MSDLGDEISSNLMSLALKKRGGTPPAQAGDSPSQSYGGLPGPTEVPDVSAPDQMPVNPGKDGLVDGSYNGAQKALKQRQNKIGDTYSAIDRDEYTK